MKFLKFTVLIIIVVGLFGCSLQTDEHAEVAVAHSEAVPIERELKLPEKIDYSEPDEVIEHLVGEAEDASLKVTLDASLVEDQSRYQTKIVYSNLSGKPIDILADCGLFIFNSKNNSLNRTCAAVESMLLKADAEEELIVTLHVDFFDDEPLISVKYRLEGQLFELNINIDNLEQ